MSILQESGSELAKRFCDRLEINGKFSDATICECRLRMVAVIDGGDEKGE